MLLPVGTAYTIGTETKTVEKAGIITVPARQTAKISGILAGSKFTVKETEASSYGYTVTYSGDNVTMENGAATGVIGVNSTVEVNVANNEDGTAVEIPVTKTIANPDGQTHAFSFQLKRVADLNGGDLEGASEPQILTLKEVVDSKTGNFTLIYLEKDIQEYPSDFFYKITETGNDSGVAYDSTVYVAKVTVSRDENGMNAVLTALCKDGNSVENKTAAFTNTLLRDLTVGKKVAGATTKGKFTFNLEVMNGDIPLTGSYPATFSGTDGTGDTLTFKEGKAQFELGADETITIHGLPKGAQWTLTETDADGYLVSWAVGDSTIQGSGASGTVNGTAVTCTNTATYELPDTGGMGTTIFYMAGAALVIGAAVLLVLKKRMGAAG